MTQVSPGQGRGQGGAGQVAAATRAGAPAARESAERAAPASLRLGMSGEESLEVAGPGGAARSAVTLGGGHPAASPCVPVPPAPAAGSGTEPSVLRAGPHSPDRRGRAGRASGKRPSAPRFTLGSEATRDQDLRESGQARGRSLLRWPDRAGC